MKNSFTILVALFIVATTFAQAPEKMSYQAVVRDSGDALVTNQAVGMQISILQTTATGTAVYVETQTPTTNVNGLVTLEIGTGSVVSGDFTTIDWSADSYFIKTETDPTGGTSYTITGTSQLLSVPYALHAKTATSLAGGIDEAYINALEARIAALEPQPEPATIGDFRAGGVVFWVDPEDSQHGLVCAIEDQSTVIQWFNGIFIETGATARGIGTGAANTNIIIANQGATETNYAAGLARAYTGGGFTDWFLPSQDELNLMYVNKAVINTTATANAGAIFSNYYWSSTEYDRYAAWRQNFNNGNQSYYNKNNTDNSVRAVRAF
ncbi:DUF1566 domain-containing protein [Winogradskyella sp.]|nr:DUF1566 domain-containing protein [Winogradskyella sp.]